MNRAKKIMVLCIVGLFIGSLIFPMINTKILIVKGKIFNDSADVPTWENGNYWTYDIDILYEAMGASADVTLKNLRFEVTDVGSENYTLYFNGDMVGSVSLAGIIEGNLKNTGIEGKAVIRKSDLAMEKLFDVHIEGDIERQFVTNSFWADMEMKQNVTPITSPYDFPINVNETWSVPIITFWLYLEAEVELAVPYSVFYDFPLYIEEHTLKCVGKENISTPAGKYKDAFHVSDDSYEFWYSPTAGNVIKAAYQNIRLWYNESLYWDINKLDVILMNTNFRPFSNPPYPPSNPNPPNGSTNVSINTDLSWSGGDPDGDPVVYDVYFGTNPNPPKVAAGLSNTTYDPGRLDYNTTYYWRIVAFDIYGYFTNGSIWTFQTEISTNNPPNKPNRPSGPTSGEIGTSYSYSSSTIDIDGDTLYYLFDWGDGSKSNWIGPYESGQIVNASHVWNREGNYSIKVKAKDTYGAESEWSDPLVVSMPKTFTMSIWGILEKINEWFTSIFGRKLLPQIFSLTFSFD
ncbi:MAG: PKD domain-containing protein [Thermoplasmata archaeon]|nr:MAG: PKD domain-containing protein [Thermoplasmata archaeon]